MLNKILILPSNVLTKPQAAIMTRQRSFVEQPEPDYILLKGYGWWRLCCLDLSIGSNSTLHVNWYLSSMERGGCCWNLPQCFCTQKYLLGFLRLNWKGKVSLFYYGTNMGEKILLKMFFWEEVTSVCSFYLALLFRLATLDGISYHTISKDYPAGLRWKKKKKAGLAFSLILLTLLGLEFQENISH